MSATYWLGRKKESQEKCRIDDDQAEIIKRFTLNSYNSIYSPLLQNSKYFLVVTSSQSTIYATEKITSNQAK